MDFVNKTTRNKLFCNYHKQKCQWLQKKIYKNFRENNKIKKIISLCPNVLTIDNIIVEECYA